MKCSEPSCTREAVNGDKFCARCRANLDDFQSAQAQELFSESEILYFLQTEADGLQDMSIQEAKLYDDIAEFGDRELKQFELRLGSQMLARYKKLKRRQRL